MTNQPIKLYYINDHNNLPYEIFKINPDLVDETLRKHVPQNRGYIKLTTPEGLIAYQYASYVFYFKKTPPGIQYTCHLK